jgi:hypothetical protein
MALTIPAYARALGNSPKTPPVRTAQPSSTHAPRTTQPERRPLGRLLRRSTPSTFHRCLAVHMHFAQRASALD